MDDAPSLIFIIFVVIALAAFGGVSLLTDNRHFSGIEAQCKQQGYIQNQTTRIFCKVEAKND
jgi:hypothetical protein